MALGIPSSPVNCCLKEHKEAWGRMTTEHKRVASSLSDAINVPAKMI
jgi:hypothetical protein